MPLFHSLSSERLRSGINGEFHIAPKGSKDRKNQLYASTLVENCGLQSAAYISPKVTGSACHPHTVQNSRLIFACVSH